MADEKSGTRPRGKRGKRGHRGHRGHTGHRGHRGHSGDDGDDGATGATGATGPAGASGLPAIAAASLDDDAAFLSNSGFDPLPVFTPPNQVSITLLNPPADPNNILAVATLLGSSITGEITYSVTAPGTINIFTYNSAGVATTHAFSVVVYDLTP